MKKLKVFINNNFIIILTILISFFIELLGITYTNCFPFLTTPLYPIIILIPFLIIIYSFKNNIVKTVLSSILLILQLIINTNLIFLYDSNGTVFEWSMFSQRNDAFGTLESFDYQYGYILICSLIILLFITICSFYIKKKKTKNTKLIKKKYLILLLIVDITLIILIPHFKEKEKNDMGYAYKLYDTTSNNYQTIGMIGNLTYQLVIGEKKIKVDNTNNIDDFIYKEKLEKSPYFGISKNNNLILILAESLEWYPLLEYPEYSNILYPNLNYLMNNGIIGENFYQKEKTDVSEAMALVGNYPTGKYLNYGFYKNNYPFSLPNLLKANIENISVNSFHANYGNFYNRYKLHQSFGFEKLYAIEEMKKFGVEDTWNHRKGERNLDSITIDKMKEVMFPTDKQFFSYIISFSSHGYYKERNNLKEYYKVLDQYIKFDKNNENDMYLRTYMATVMDFDKALGILIDYLKNNNLLNKTTIAIHADHNAYYNKLSYYMKNINETFNSEIYHIPFIIYDEKLLAAYTNNNSNNKIQKFTTVADITPTLLDLYGIAGWKNLYFGSSMFTPSESIIYSRNYGIFITNKLVGYSLNNLTYKNKHINEKDLKSFEKRSLIHLKKLEYIDKIYYSNYFKNNNYIQ